ncbi:ATP-binding protein [Streptomyces sioyaensis]|uniref:ATP-binding protein n=1 Tax=Streptomyces sioyaensis TaxID=67364 RepID=UPI0037D18CE7
MRSCLTSLRLADHVQRPSSVTATPHGPDKSRTAPDNGRVPGRCFRLGLVVTSPATLRIEVTDTRGDQLPVRTPNAGGLLAESGRGLLLVAELADRWGVEEGPVPCKTVWAELDLGPAIADGPSCGPVRSHDTSATAGAKRA